MNMSPAACEEEHYLTERGFLSCHLCLNAQTEQFHTEHDASYIIIAVPTRINSSSRNETSNKTKFEFVLNQNQVIIVPMHPGTIMAYSGYMLTHRQQIMNLDTLALTFVNIVAYNFKRLSSNLMESFCRDINCDNKSLRNNKPVKLN